MDIRSPRSSHVKVKLAKCCRFQALRDRDRVRKLLKRRKQGDDLLGGKCEKHVPTKKAYEWSMVTFGTPNITAARQFDAREGLTRATE